MGWLRATHARLGRLELHALTRTLQHVGAAGALSVGVDDGGSTSGGGQHGTDEGVQEEQGGTRADRQAFALWLDAAKEAVDAHAAAAHARFTRAQAAQLQMQRHAGGPHNAPATGVRARMQAAAAAATARELEASRHNSSSLEQHRQTGDESTAESMCGGEVGRMLGELIWAVGQLHVLGRPSSPALQVCGCASVATALPLACFCLILPVCMHLILYLSVPACFHLSDPVCLSD